MLYPMLFKPGTAIIFGVVLQLLERSQERIRQHHVQSLGKSVRIQME